MKFTSVRLAIVAFATIAAGGCSILHKDKPKTPVLGERISVLATDRDVLVDPDTAALPMTLPAAVANPQWAQSGGNASKSIRRV